MGMGYFVMMNVAFGFWLICALIMVMVAVTIGRERERLLSLMAQRAEEIASMTTD